MIFKILILCRGNITRSPFIAGYLNHLYRKSDLVDKVLLDIDSSGIEGKFNQPVHPKILAKGLELGFDLAMYRSKHSDFKSLEKSDLIIVVDKHQYRRFQENYPQLLEKVYLLFELGREQDTEQVDLQDPSHSNEETSFEEFFDITVSETERIWHYIESVFRRCEIEGKPFNPKLFHKPEQEEVPTLKRYNFLTRRFFPVCPHCQSKRLRRLRRQGFWQKRVFPKFNGYPYHCGHCNHNSILFIGSELSHRKTSDKKIKSWMKFLEMEKSLEKDESKIDDLK